MRASRIGDAVASAAGLVGVVLMAVGVMLGDTADQARNPNPTQSGEALAEALVSNRDEARLGSYLLLFAAFLLLLFTARLAGHLRERAVQGDWMSLAVLGGGAALVAVLLVETGFALAVSELETYGADTAVARTLFLWGWNSAFLYAAPLAAMAAGTTVAAFAQGLFPTWARWGSALLVALMLLVFLTGVPGMATGLGLLWLMFASVGLTLNVLRQPSQVAPAPADPAL